LNIESKEAGHQPVFRKSEFEIGMYQADIRGRESDIGWHQFGDLLIQSAFVMHQAVIDASDRYWDCLGNMANRHRTGVVMIQSEFVMHQAVIDASDRCWDCLGYMANRHRTGVVMIQSDVVILQPVFILIQNGVVMDESEQHGHQPGDVMLYRYEAVEYLLKANMYLVGKITDQPKFIRL
jgi:hypothetical protein